jgi:LmbE family N-acetylglucosaminyl deacetylase
VCSSDLYPVDGRYLTIWFITLVVCAAVALRSLRLGKKLLIAVHALLLLALAFAFIGSYDQYQRSQDGLQPQKAFQAAVVRELTEQKVGVLVGDYWDVTPIKQQAGDINIVPMADCKNPLTALSSTAWQKRPPKGQTTAYLVNSNPFPTSFTRCDPQAVTSYFGEPTRKIALQTADHEGSWLYIYDNGMDHVIPRGPKPAVKPATAKPEPPLPLKDCPNGSVLNVVAHEDDDLLFLNPDLQAAIDAGKCITTVFVTAGDAGAGESYSAGRQNGSEAAYAYMYNVELPGVWHSRQLQVNGKMLRYSTMEGAPGLSLIFLNLPDGNMKGNGFKSSDHESLSRLRSGVIKTMAAREGGGRYTANDLTDMLLLIMNTYNPQEVRTQGYGSIYDGDHSDHHAVGRITRDAFDKYHQTATLRSYAGYTSRLRAANVTGSVLAAKEGAFFTYAGFDGAACATVIDCYGKTAYGQYLPRQYSREVAVSQPLPSIAVPAPAQPATPPVPQVVPKPKAVQIGRAHV